MTVKVGNTEFTFDGYYNTPQTIRNLAEKCYQQGREDERNNIGIFLRRRNLYALEKDYEKWLKEK